MLIDFERKTILITGGTRGLGRAIAETYLNSNAKKVIITGTSVEEPIWIRSHDRSSHLEYRRLNFLDDTHLEQIKQILNSSPEIDVCVNNAGINSIYPLEEFPENLLKNILRVNLEGPMALIKYLIPNMKKNNYGRIVNIGSIFGIVSKAHRSAYTASKSGLIGTTKSIALEVSSLNILVNSVSPGFFDTELTRRVLGESGMEEIQKQIPIGKIGKPDWLASTVLFLTSDLNQYIAGQNIVVDGGFVCE